MVSRKAQRRRDLVQPAQRTRTGKNQQMIVRNGPSLRASYRGKTKKSKQERVRKGIPPWILRRAFR